MWLSNLKFGFSSDVQWWHIIQIPLFEWWHIMSCSVWVVAYEDNKDEGFPENKLDNSYDRHFQLLTRKKISNFLTTNNLNHFHSLPPNSILKYIDSTHEIC
jgi:hypothetical protein